MEISKLKTEERIIQILVRAFDTNKSVRYICGTSSGYRNKIHNLMLYSIENCRAFGKIYISPDSNACALVLFPDKKKTSWKSLQADIRLARKVIGLPKIFKALKRETLIKSFQPKEPFCYLWFIAVDPVYQGLGKGSELLHHIIKDANNMNRIIHLETSTVENLPLYQRFGFNVVGELDLGYRIYVMNNKKSING